MNRPTSLKEDEKLIGRKEEIEELTRDIKKRKDVLLVGEPGNGKTEILREVFRRIDEAGRDKIIFIEHTAPFRLALIDMARQIHCKYKDLRLYDIDEEKIVEMEWGASEKGKSIKRMVERMNVRELARVIIDSVKGKDYIIILDQLERVTPTAKSVLEIIIDKTCVIGSYSGYPQNAGNLKKLWWKFKIMEIKNLSREEAEELIDYYFDEYKIFSENQRMYKKRILKISRGNPMAIKGICYEGSIEKYVDKKMIREIGHDAGTKYIDGTPFVILALVFFVALRFFALGMNDTDVYVFAGGMTGIGLFVRFVLFRYLR